MTTKVFSHCIWVIQKEKKRKHRSKLQSSPYELFTWQVWCVYVFVCECGRVYDVWILFQTATPLFKSQPNCTIQEVWTTTHSSPTQPPNGFDGFIHIRCRSVLIHRNVSFIYVTKGDVGFCWRHLVLLLFFLLLRLLKCLHQSMRSRCGAGNMKPLKRCRSSQAVFTWINHRSKSFTSIYTNTHSLCSINSHVFC